MVIKWGVMMSIEFSVPVHWDFVILDHVYRAKKEAEQRRNEKLYVVMYGALPADSFGTGRIPSALGTASQENAVNYIDRARKYGFRFRYLLNALNITTKSTQANIDSTLDSVVNTLGVDEIAVSQEWLVKKIRARYPSIGVTLSTIAAVCTPEQIRYFAQYGLKSICMHHDANRNIPQLRECIEEAGRNGVHLELMLTENCVDQCPIRAQHYAVLGTITDTKKSIDEFQIPCWLEKLWHPEEIIAASWINPEGIQFYRNLGIDHFKITGRDKKAERLPLVIAAYFGQAYEGNFMRLLGTAPQPVDIPVEAEDLVFLDNKSLKNFYDRLDAAFSQGVSYREFCRGFTRELFESEKLSLLDSDSKYAIQDGIVTLQKPGKFYQTTRKYVGHSKVFYLWEQARREM